MYTHITPTHPWIRIVIICEFVFPSFLACQDFFDESVPLPLLKPMLRALMVNLL